MASLFLDKIDPDHFFRQVISSKQATSESTESHESLGGELTPTAQAPQSEQEAEVSNYGRFFKAYSTAKRSRDS